MIENKFTRCEPDDPNRCQSVVAHGQCPYKAVEGYKTCPMHTSGGVIRKDRERNYRLDKYHTRVMDFATNDDVKSLREEIGILRMILEETLNQCKDAQDLVMFSTKISDLVLKIEKLVVSCHRLEAATGVLLDRSTVINFTENLIQIISVHIPDTNVLETISTNIIDALVSNATRTAKING